MHMEELEHRLTPSTIQVVPGPNALQAAINAASPGDTLLIAHGTYREDIIVNKPLTLIGQPDANHQNPFLVGNGGAAGKEVVVDIAASGVSLSHVAVGDSHGAQAIQVGVLVEPGIGFFSFSFSVIRKVRDTAATVLGTAATVGLKAQPGSHDLTVSHVALYNINAPISAGPLSNSSSATHSYAYGVWLQGANNVAMDHTYAKDMTGPEVTGFFVSGGSDHVFLNYCATEELFTPAPIGFSVSDSTATLSGCKAYDLLGQSIGLKLSAEATVDMLFGQLAEDAWGVVEYGANAFSPSSVDISGNRVVDRLQLP